MSVARTCCPTLANKWENSSPQTKAFLKFIAFCIVSGAFAAATYGTNYAYGWLPANQAIAIPIYVLTGVGVTSVILLIKFCVSKKREPAPQPQPQPQPAPAPSPKPAPQPQPRPAPKPQPAPQPKPQPQPRPDPAPKPADKVVNPFLPAHTKIFQEGRILEEADFCRYFIDLTEEEHVALQDHLQNYEYYIEARTAIEEVEGGHKIRYAYLYYKLDDELLKLRYLMRDDGSIRTNHIRVNDEILTAAEKKRKQEKIKLVGQVRSFLAGATQLVPPVADRGPSPLQQGQVHNQEKEEPVELPAYTRMHKKERVFSNKDVCRVFTGLSPKQHDALRAQLQDYEFYMEVFRSRKDPRSGIERRCNTIIYRVGDTILEEDVFINADGSMELDMFRFRERVNDAISREVSPDKIKKGKEGPVQFFAVATQLVPVECPPFWPADAGPYTTEL